MSAALPPELTARKGARFYYVARASVNENARSCDESALRLTHQPPVLDLHRERRAGDDSEKREERAERECGKARYSLADGATQRDHAAETHQRAADQVIDQILGVAKALQPERPGRERPGERAREHPEHRRDPEGHHAALVAPQKEKLERVGLRRDEGERLHAAGVGGEEFFLERGRILGEVADVP